MPLNLCSITKGYLIDKRLMDVDYAKKTILNSNERTHPLKKKNLDSTGGKMVKACIFELK